MSTPDDRRDHAVRAARDAATDLGLDADDATPVHDVFSVVVHLAPSPVVARVPTVLPVSLTEDEQDDRQRRELAVAGTLARLGIPVVAPSPLVPAEPVRRDGLSMTFWTHVDVLAAPRADDDAVRVVDDVHAGMRDLDVPGLGFLSSLHPFVDTGLAALAGRPGVCAPDDLARAREQWAVLGPLVTDEARFRAAFPRARVRPIHGDAPFHNLIATPSGLLASDFEDATRGPVEWDLAFVGEDVLTAYEAAAGPVDRRLLAVMEMARFVQLVAALDLASALPMLIDGLAPVLADWRTRTLDGLL